jgi:2-methylisocitrate lyase-like PEP mutase family enzyme
MRVPLRISFELVETRITSTCARCRRCIRLVEVREHRHHRRMQTVQVEAIKSHFARSAQLVVVRAQPAHEIEDVCIPPHPRRKAAKVAQCLLGISIGPEAPHVTVHTIGVRPVCFRRHRGKTLLQDQALGDLRTPSIEFMRPMRGLSNQHVAGAARQLQHGIQIGRGFRKWTGGGFEGAHHQFVIGHTAYQQRPCRAVYSAIAGSRSVRRRRGKPARHSGLTSHRCKLPPMSASTRNPVSRLREQLAAPGLRLMPCCFDALSARLIAEAGFELTFMSGFGVSAARLGAPDTGLISYAEMLDQGRNICAAASIPVIGDADTGYGNALNVKRTVKGYAQVGFAGVMVEDQLAPKRCGHTEGKQVVSREEACERIRAAVDARNEGADIVLVARTDARATHGLEEALARARAFAELGADVVFVEALLSTDEMRAACASSSKPMLANMLEGGKTPVLPPAELEALGYKLAAYPVTLLSVAIQAMRDALASLARGESPSGLLPFAELRRSVGFDTYDAEAARYAGQR